MILRKIPPCTRVAVEMYQHCLMLVLSDVNLYIFEIFLDFIDI